MVDKQKDIHYLQKRPFFLYEKWNSQNKLDKQFWTKIECIWTKMSKTTKRKYVAKEVLEEYYVPENEETIVKVFFYYFKLN